MNTQFSYLLELFWSDIEDVNYLKLLFPRDRLYFQLSEGLNQIDKINSEKLFDKSNSGKKSLKYFLKQIHLPALYNGSI